MADIYGNSLVTIAAARSSSADFGFLQSRAVGSQNIAAYKLPYECSDGRLGSITLLSGNKDSEPIDERALAYQERLLSPRTIEFGSRQTRWICQEMYGGLSRVDGWKVNPEYQLQRLDIRNRDILYRNDHKVPIYQNPQSSEYGNAIGHWRQLVSTFSRRLLTAETDRCLAIAGIADRFGQVFGDEYLAGLWKSNLSHGLLWRQDHERSLHQPRWSHYQGPTWSWTSINGAVDFLPFIYTNWSREQCKIELIDYDIYLVNDGAPYGAIRPSSGRLVLRGRMLPGILLQYREATTVEVHTGTVVFMSLNDARLDEQQASMRQAYV
jgi:hypothetical protein